MRSAEQRSLRLALIAAWATCAALIVASACAGLHLLREQSALRLDPFELEVYADWPRLDAPPPGVRRVVFFGDSRARSWPEPRALEGFEFENRGVGHQTSAQVLGRVDHDLAPLAADVVVLQAGVNDLKAIGFFPARRAHIIARCVRNLRAVVERVRALGAHVILTTVFSASSAPRWREWLLPEGLSSAIAEVNRPLRALAGPEVSVLDSASVLDDPPGRLRPEFRHDSLHVNAAGYRALEGVLRARLRALFGPGEPTRRP